MKQKATFIISMEDDGHLANGYPEEGFVGFAHSSGFGSGCEFTACGVDLAWGNMKTKKVRFVDCPLCIRAMGRDLKNILSFEVTK